MLLSRNSIKNRKIVKEKNERNECTAIGGSWYVAYSSNSDWRPNTSANSPKWTILLMRWTPSTPPTISLNHRTNATARIRRNRTRLIDSFYVNLCYVLSHLIFLLFFFHFFHKLWKTEFPVFAWFVIKKSMKQKSYFF